MDGAPIVETARPPRCSRQPGNAAQLVITLRRRSSIVREQWKSCRKRRPRSQSVDQRGSAATQSPSEDKNARGGGREGDETNRGGGPAKGEDDWRRSWSSSLRTRLEACQPQVDSDLRRSRSHLPPDRQVPLLCSRGRSSTKHWMRPSDLTHSPRRWAISAICAHRTARVDD